MRELAKPGPRLLPASSARALALAVDLERELRVRPQLELETHHFLHAGVYARTIRLLAGTIVTGALVKIPTVLIVSGDVMVTIGDEEVRISGYSVLPAAAGRKQSFVALAETHLTMTFATAAKTVAEAEAEFTDETHLLLSRQKEAC